MKLCDSCHKYVGNYKENNYTYLCGICWTQIAHNMYLDWQKDKNVYIWLYTSEKVI